MYDCTACVNGRHQVDGAPRQPDATNVCSGCCLSHRRLYASTAHICGVWTAYSQICRPVAEHVFSDNPRALLLRQCSNLHAFLTAGAAAASTSAQQLQTDVVALLDEWATRFFCELDYVAEGQNADLFAQQMAQDLPQVRLFICPLTATRYMRLLLG